MSESSFNAKIIMIKGKETVYVAMCGNKCVPARPQTPVDTQVGKVMYSGSTSYFFIPCHLEHASYVPQCETFVKIKSAGEEIAAVEHNPTQADRHFMRDSV